jgi:hypothetical protein
MNESEVHDDAQERAMQLPPDLGADVETLQPWEEIETGRFMPRRIRGSYRGGKLG